jgi:hypothetical protein
MPSFPPESCHFLSPARQSLFSGIRVATIAKLDQDSQTLLGRHRRITARIGFVCVLEAGKDPDRLLHILNLKSIQVFGCPTDVAFHGRRRPRGEATRHADATDADKMEIFQFFF